jgi:hypothetical protein
MLGRASLRDALALSTETASQQPLRTFYMHANAMQVGVASSRDEGVRRRAHPVPVGRPATSPADQRRSSDWYRLPAGGRHQQQQRRGATDKKFGGRAASSAGLDHGLDVGPGFQFSWILLWADIGL